VGTPDGEYDDSFHDARSATSAVDFLQSYNDERPFYREVGFFSPHTPCITPLRFKKLYRPEKLQRPPDWTGPVMDNAFVETAYPTVREFEREGFWQRSVRNYYSAYSHGDHHLGRVLDALAASRHAANTVVILVSDHGFHLGNRNLFRKTTMWEQSLHVPLIIFDPSDPVGRVVDDPVGLIDLGPTVLDFAGVPPPPRKHGRSLRPYLHGARDPDRVIPSFYKGNASIRKGRYRIIRYGDGSHQLFDCVDDYWQLRDLGEAHPAFAGMKAALAATAAACGFDLTVTTGPDGAGPEDADGSGANDEVAET
jgi:arylsulfatase A-like enzyme